MKKIILMLFISIFLISLTLASPGTYKQNSDIRLTQTCSDCTFINISSVIAPDGTQLIGNNAMDKTGVVFNYTLINNYTQQLGEYRVNGLGDSEGTNQVWMYSFEVTPSGQGGTENTTFFIFIILLIYGITFFGFFGKNIPITILGGMAMMFLGVYLINQGVIIYRDTITLYVAYLTISIGAITSIWAILEQLEVI